MQSKYTIDGHGLRWPCDALGAANPIPPEQIAVAAAWIAAFVLPATAIRICHSSYGLKHMVENWTTRHGGKVYVSNGAFIQAAVNAGFTIITDNSLNCMFKMKWASRTAKSDAYGYRC